MHLKRILSKVDLLKICACYPSDNYMLFLTSWDAKMMSCFSNVHHLGSGILDFNFF